MKLTVLILILSSIGLYAKEAPSYSFIVITNDICIVQSIDSFPGKSAEELYSLTKAWLAKTYSSSKAVIQLDDKENMKIIGRGKGQILWRTATCIVDYLIQIDIKEGRARFQIKELEFSTTANSAKQPIPFTGPAIKPETFYVKLDEHLLALHESFIKSLNNDTHENDDW